MLAPEYIGVWARANGQNMPWTSQVVGLSKFAEIAGIFKMA